VDHSRALSCASLTIIKDEKKIVCHEISSWFICYDVCMYACMHGYNYARMHDRYVCISLLCVHACLCIHVRKSAFFVCMCVYTRTCTSVLP